MKLSKMLLLTLVISAIGIALVNLFYWVVMYTRIGTTVLVACTLIMWYAFYKITEIKQVK